MIPVSRPLITASDREAVMDSLRNAFVSGDSPPVRRMESALSGFLGVSETVAVSSGTTALDLAVESLGLKKGDKVIAPSFTIVSSISQLMRKGLEIILVDSDPNTWSIDANRCAELLDDQISLVVAVHIYGLSANMGPILEKSKALGVRILEDAAESLGAKYYGKPTGAIGDLSVFSFYANKIVTGGEGGAICTNDQTIAKNLRSLRNLCFNPNQRYVHEDVGWNARLNALSASLIESQLSRIESSIKSKIEQANRYKVGLHNHPWLEFQPSSTSYSDNVFWVIGVILNEECPFDAEEMQIKLRSNEIDSRRFFCPMHLQPFSNRYKFTISQNMKVSEMLWRRGLYLPSGLGIENSEIDQVVDILWSFVR